MKKFLLMEIRQRSLEARGSGLILALLATLLFATEGRAATRTVTNLNDSGPGSLRATIAAANAGDFIDFRVYGTISLTSGHLVINKNLTIAGDGARLITIRRSSITGTPGSRIFFISNGTNRGPTVKISGLTLADGLIDGTFGDGGCLYNDAGTVELTHCHLRDNRASNNGGAIFNDGAGSGRTATITLNSCTLSGNYALQSGGAIYNTGAGGGAGAYLTNCTLFRNGAGDSGRAAYTVTTPGPAATDNWAVMDLRNCTLVDYGPAGNARENGSIVADRSTVYLLNSILFSGGQVTFQERNSAGFSSGSFISRGYNLARERDKYFLTGTADQFNDLYPVDQAGLQPNGGPVPTLALTPGSLALDRGQGTINVDARGRSRPHDFAGVFNASSGNGSDIGAYEADDLLQTADVLTVKASSDHDDGTCGFFDCSLREAAARIEALRGVTPTPEKLKITFGGLTGTISLDHDVTVDGPLQIEGPGARILAISLSGTDPGLNARAFTIGNRGPVMISGLTIRDGAVFGPDTGGANAFGGGILNTGNLTVNDCYFENNRAYASATSTAKGGDAFGGAIYNIGTLLLNRCTLKNNEVRGGAGAPNVGSGYGGAGGSGLGGGIFNGNGGTLTLNNCTVAGNTGTGGNGGGLNFGGNGGNGVGAIYNSATMTMTATTVSDNNANGGRGGTGYTAPGNRGVAIAGISVATPSSNTLRNSIVAGNRGQDANGGFNSAGFNLIGVGDFSTGFNANGDQVGTTAAPIDPRLGALKNNGGATDTMELLAGSPALDTGNSFGLTTDQRGFTRPLDLPIANAGDGSDIGAFEAQQSPQFAVPTRFGNISTRLRVEAGDNVLIGGFIVTGSTQKRTIVRALGPSLPLGGVLANPKLDLYDRSGTLIASNDNWREAANSQEISDSTIPPTNDLEAAVLLNVDPGAHTAVVSSANGTVGVGLIEVYDLGGNQDSKLANISTRGRVLTGEDVMIGGFIITGSTGQKVIVRAIGPSLPIASKLENPSLELYDANGTLTASNDNWRDTQQQEIEATTIPPSNDLESALVTVLAPAAYTAIVRGVNDTTGVALVEVYALQP